MQICLKTLKNSSGIRLGALVFVACSLLGACSNFTTISEGSKSKLGSFFRPYRPDMVQGNFISKEQLAKLKLGADREEVKVVLGTPLLTSAMHANRWDYIFAYKRGDTQLVEQRRVTIYFEKDLVAKIDADELPTEYELIAEIDGIKGSRRPQRPPVAKDLGDGSAVVQPVPSVPNPTQGVGIPRGDTRN